MGLYWRCICIQFEKCEMHLHVYLRVSPFAPLVSPFCTSLTYTYEIATLFSPYFKCRHLLCTIYAVIMINILIMNKCERLGVSERWCAEDSYTSCRVVNAEVNRPMQHCQQNMYYVCATVVWAEDLKSKMLAIEWKLATYSRPANMHEYTGCMNRTHSARQ